ncbi:RdgB/HAM1 family non-canonical purine NTP pyrophosphatase, partial [bacterium]|nr:RdgB/HAM1 family non-canonical purine NTP pyrophosphatase [bacterium]
MTSKLVLATRNLHKVAEIQAMLTGTNLEVLCLSDFPEIPEIIEDGETFQENAAKKANTVFEYTGLPALADDSGLEVDYLNGRPGVYSARFSGENAADAENNAKLLQMLDGVSAEKRTARFCCVMVLRLSAESLVFDGTAEGQILTEPHGSSGFGYDPLFFSSAENMTFA